MLELPHNAHELGYDYAVTANAQDATQADSDHACASPSADEQERATLRADRNTHRQAGRVSSGAHKEERVDARRD